MIYCADDWAEDGEKVKEEDVEWCRIAAEAGDAYAMYILGEMYRWGFGFEENDEEALKWFQRAADLGNIDAKIAFLTMTSDGSKEDRERIEMYIENPEIAVIMEGVE